MKTTYTKKRNITSANLLLERRYLMKEQLLTQANVTSVLDDPSFFANNWENLAATYTTPPGEPKPTSAPSTVATHYIPGDKKYKYIKNNDGSWSTIRLSDQKVISLKDNAAATQQLNSEALPIGTKPPKKSASVSSSSSSAETVASGTPGTTSNPASSTQTQAQLTYKVNNSMALFNKARMIYDEINNNYNSDETKIINLLQTINKPDMDAFINIYKNFLKGDLSKDLSRTISNVNDKKEYKQLQNIFSKLGYQIVPGKQIGSAPAPYTIQKIS